MIDEKRRGDGASSIKPQCDKVALLEEGKGAGKPIGECSMTLYRLYLRSGIRRDRLSPRQTRCEAAPPVPPSAEREESMAMIYGNYRYSYVISGCETFAADDDAAALAIARSICDAASDLCDMFELWDGTRQIDQSRLVALQASAILQRRQEHVIEVEEALFDSGWAIARSRRLLARLNELRAETASGDSVLPTATRY
jgi:hypothetical protein